MGGINCSICIVSMSSCCPAPMAEWNKKALAALKGQLKENIIMVHLRNILEIPAGGFMNEAEAISVTEKSGDSDQMEQVIMILRGKGDDEFATFCEMLKQSSYEVWANKLKSTAESYKKGQGEVANCHPVACSAMMHCYY